LGDQAILAGLCRLVHEECPDVEIDVASLAPFVTLRTQRLLPETRIRSVRGLAEAEAAVRRGEYGVVAVAGGPLMTPVRELLLLHRLMLAALDVGARFAILGCGLGPLHGAGARKRAIEQMVQAADVCIWRDASSAALALRMADHPEVGESACDPAFFWEALAVRNSERTSNRLTVALALRDWPLHEYAGGLAAEDARRIKERFEGELVVMVRRLVAGPEAVCVVPVCMHSLAVGGDDRMFYRRVFAEIPEVADAVVWRRRDPHEELDRLRQADAVCAMRFHSAVFSLALGRPFLAIDYTHGGKIDALLSAAGERARLVRLEEFDGCGAAERLLLEAAGPVRPRSFGTTAAEAVFRRALGRLFE